MDRAYQIGQITLEVVKRLLEELLFRSCFRRNPRLAAKFLYMFLEVGIRGLSLQNVIEFV